MSVSDKALESARRIGSNGGTVDTSGMSHDARNKINNAVNDGRRSSGH